MTGIPVWDGKRKNFIISFVWLLLQTITLYIFTAKLFAKLVLYRGYSPGTLPVTVVCNNCWGSHPLVPWPCCGDCATTLDSDSGPDSDSICATAVPTE